jgi:hypothetical protein
MKKKPSYLHLPTRYLAYQTDAWHPHRLMYSLPIRDRGYLQGTDVDSPPVMILDWMASEMEPGTRAHGYRYVKDRGGIDLIHNFRLVRFETGECEAEFETFQEMVWKFKRNIMELRDTRSNVVFAKWLRREDPAHGPIWVLEWELTKQTNHRLDEHPSTLAGEIFSQMRYLLRQVPADKFDYADTPYNGAQVINSLPPAVHFFWRDVFGSDPRFCHWQIFGGRDHQVPATPGQRMVFAYLKILSDPYWRARHSGLTREAMQERFSVMIPVKLRKLIDDCKAIMQLHDPVPANAESLFPITAKRPNVDPFNGVTDDALSGSLPDFLTQNNRW